MIRVGRITSAIIMVVVGIMLLYDQAADTNYLGYVLDWWPLILILLGIEYLWINLKYQKSEKQLRLDVGGVLIAVVVVIAVVGVTQSRWLPTQWFQNMNWESIVKGELGKKFELDKTTIPLSERTEKVAIDNPYGSIIVKSGTGTGLEIQRTVWVNRSDEKEAERIATETQLVYSEGSTLTVVTESEEKGWWWGRQPHIELVVTVPSNREVNWVLKGKNGSIEAADIPLKDLLEADTSNGSVTLAELHGDVQVRTSNGAVKVNSVQGAIRLETSNGSITAQDIGGTAYLETSNASITADRISGKLTADTNNGRVTVTDPSAGMEIDTSNGSVSVSSRQVGGDWKVGSSNGKVELRLPSTGSYEVDGRGGSVSTNLPLEVSNNDKKVKGRIGGGEHKIKIETSNAGISLQRAD
ncbi:DUF4097 family beta strand repeat-containing protein [Paenibacillus koleovorans]|uniref:DUF4097 family beta strand repeat-containing protein n=1 Tax=Paenibacillus koleovorans TaxID=121608 RepID=UPI000FD824FC|nr:DUF4097 family beta strand repeat-containing protein [Paenibacillus koleovorans]